MRLVDRQVRCPLADRPGGLRQVEHHQKQGEERSHDGRNVEDAKARHQEIESGVRQRLSGQFAAPSRKYKKGLSHTNVTETSFLFARARDLAPASTFIT